MTAMLAPRPLTIDELRGVRDALTDFLDGIPAKNLDHEAVSRLVSWPVEDLSQTGYLDALPKVHEKIQSEDYDMWVAAPGKRFVIGEYVPQWGQWVIWSENATQRRRLALDLDEFLLGQCNPFKDTYARCLTKEEALRELADHPIAHKSIGEHISEFAWSLGGLGLRQLMILRSIHEYLDNRSPEMAELVCRIDEEFNEYLGIKD